MEEIDTSYALRNSNLTLEIDDRNLIINKVYRKPVVFPLVIKLESDLLRALYLFWGDGSYIQKLHFTNKEPELHLYIVRTFEKYFKIPGNLWRLRVLYNEDGSEIAENIKSKWVEWLKFKKNQLYPKIGITVYKTNENGNGRIIIDKLTYCDFLKAIIFYVNSLVTSNDLDEYQLISILDGILNAEGSAQIDNVGLHKIVITLNKKEIEFVRNILSQLDINDVFLERQGKLTVMGWRNLYKFIKLFTNNDLCLFSIHSKRRYNAINGFLMHKRTVALYRYLSIIEKNDVLTLGQLAKIAKRDSSSAKVVILERLKEFTNVSGGGVRGKRYKICLSDKGKEFLTTVRKLESWGGENSERKMVS